MIRKVTYQFNAEVWQYSPPGGWYFLNIPEELSNEIRELFGCEEEGWGRLKAKAIIGKCEWQTSIWFDTKQKKYLLPLKAEIRKKENLISGMSIDALIQI